MTPVTLDALATRLSKGSGRRIVAIAGPPAGGKSAAACALRMQLGSHAAVLEMDGFHYDDAVLTVRGLLARKGAPETFDVDGLAHMLERLHHGTSDVAAPRFDRALEIARAGAEVIAAEVEIVIVEGNWLLLDAPGWRELKSRFELTVWCGASEVELRRRLTARWESFGKTPEEIAAKLESNDLPNARRATAESLTATLEFVIG